MTLAVGNVLGKLRQTYSQDLDGKWTAEVVVPSELVTGEQYHEFEVLSITGGQGDSAGFTVTLRLVR